MGHNHPQEAGMAEDKDQSRVEAVKAAGEAFQKEQLRQFALSDIGRLLGISQSQVVRATQNGKLPTKRVMVASAEDIERFASQYIIKDKNGKARVAWYPNTDKDQ